MKARKKTIIFMAVVLLAIIVYDVIVYLNDETGDTISRIIFEWSFNVPVLPFAWGCLMGHFFWAYDGKWRIKILAILVLVFIALPFISIHLNPMVPFVIGIPAGHFLWSMRR